MGLGLTRGSVINANARAAGNGSELLFGGALAAGGTLLVGGTISGSAATPRPDPRDRRGIACDLALSWRGGVPAGLDGR
jgi:hypothetical protein